MKILIATLLLGFSTVASAAGPYLMICKSNKMTFSLKRELKHDGVINGWQKYWGQVDYALLNKSGSLDAHISWKKDTRLGYNTLMIALLDKSEVAIRKKGLEGGSVGFGSLYSQAEIKDSFKAKWSTHGTSEDAPELESFGEELNCEIQK